MGASCVFCAAIGFIYDLVNGYEPFNIRSWQGLRPIHRLSDVSSVGTLESMRDELKDIPHWARGEDSAVKRANAKIMKARFAKAWERDGEAWVEIKRIVDLLH